MADDDKKINLPDIIPEVDRREVIRGGIATLGRAFMGSLPGAISDLTPADIIPTTKVASPMSITGAFAQLLNRSNNLEEKVADLSWYIHPIVDGNDSIEAAGNVIRGRDIESINDAIQNLVDQDLEFEESGGPTEPIWQGREDLERTMDEIDSEVIRVLDNTKKLKTAFKEDYPDDFVDWLFDTDKGKSILADTIDNILYDNQYEDNYPLQSWKLPLPDPAGMSEGPEIYRELPREELGEDQRNAFDLLENEVIPTLIREAIPEYEKEKKVKIKDIPWEAVPENPKLPSPVEEGIKKVAKATATHGLGRLLNQLATKKDKGTKQIEGPKESKPSLNRLLNALTIFRRTSPIGAAASVMRPTPTAHDDHYDFQIPVDR